MNRHLVALVALLGSLSLIPTGGASAKEASALIASPVAQSVMSNTLADPASEIVIASTTGWHDMPLTLKQGYKYSISYLDGVWTVDSNRFPYVGPRGYSPNIDRQVYQGCKSVPSLPYARLLGSIGNGPIFSIGTGGTFTAGENGRLSLRINDQDFCLGDNAGSIRIDLPGQIGFNKCENNVCEFALDHNLTQDFIIKIDGTPSGQLYPALVGLCLKYFRHAAFGCGILATEIVLLAKVTSNELKAQDYGRGVYITVSPDVTKIGIIPQT